MFTSRIYSAVYSGVPVFEMIVNGVTVMRRQKDSYMNATQILKVANIDKGKRTKILEKEILVGEHEKVQGGYGKYQGTWIPFEKSKELAERYSVLQALGPLLELDVNTSPAINSSVSLPTKEQATLALRSQGFENTNAVQQQSLNEQHSKSEDLNVDETANKDQQQQPQQEVQAKKQKNIQLLASRHNPMQTQPISPKPMHPPQTQTQTRPFSTFEEDGKLPARKKVKTTDTLQPLQSHMEKQENSEKLEHLNEISVTDENNRSVLMSIFLSDQPEQVLELLQADRSSLDIDMVIDESGHTALHWATALARIGTVEKLVERGANVSCMSYTGETPLMRGVLVTNNFDDGTFPKILELLESSITTLDNKKRSVLHHACLSAGVSDRVNAAVYYVDFLLKTIMKNEKYKYIIDLQDSLGDTATTIAARLNNSGIVELLSKAGATRVMENNVGLVSDDYEEERTPNPKNYQEEEQINKTAQSDSFSFSKKLHGPSQRGKEIVATVQKIVDALDNEYGNQLESKEQQLNSIQQELDNITKELESTRKEVEKRQIQSQKLSEAQQKTRNIENALEVGWSRLEEIMEKAGEKMPDRMEIDNFDENEDIDELFVVSNLNLPKDATDDEKKIKMKEQVQKLQAVVNAYKINDELLKKEIKEIQDQFAEKETQCKRLIAACCNLPIEKIDDLVEPLTLAIESDPPDLDLARVIGFMDKVKRQGAFPEAPITSSMSPLRMNTRDSPSLPTDANTNDEADLTTPPEA
ncbi:hypothetical protein G6F46_003375 [Rhizopus delemar]|nr:hypothetical protein G6F54_003085 [Rhizopus delemar]KAG1515212.1 hypothetical protein G6F53_003086 [Rhizopus delemar]KAG1562416.1 hypothetical protein G6F49_000928 [Rhizopus delemar]KAG1605298.1 hypothetical protein G6F47_000125 [Rhizopus delemar]KAG1619156.1 hypothetical protein G6F46_003375 [Rhizopus delemar]